MKTGIWIAAVLVAAGPALAAETAPDKGKAAPAAEKKDAAHELSLIHI